MELEESTCLTSDCTHQAVFSCCCVLESPCVCQSLRHIPLCVTPGTVAPQAPLSMEFRQEYWSGLPFPSPLGLEKASI